MVTALVPGTSSAIGIDTANVRHVRPGRIGIRPGHDVRMTVDRQNSRPLAYSWWKKLNRTRTASALGAAGIFRTLQLDDWPVVEVPQDWWFRWAP